MTLHATCYLRCMVIPNGYFRIQNSRCTCLPERDRGQIAWLVLLCSGLQLVDILMLDSSFESIWNILSLANTNRRMQMASLTVQLHLCLFYWLIDHTLLSSCLPLCHNLKCINSLISRIKRRKTSMNQNFQELILVIGLFLVGQTTLHLCLERAIVSQATR